MPNILESLANQFHPEFDRILRDLLSDVIRKCDKSRAEIAATMTGLLKQKVTPQMLYDFTAESKRQHRFPLCFVAAFCVATGDHRLEKLVLTPRMRKLVEVGETHLAAERQIRPLLRDLGIEQ